MKKTHNNLLLGVFWVLGSFLLPLSVVPTASANPATKPTKARRAHTSSRPRKHTPKATAKPRTRPQPRRLLGSLPKAMKGYELYAFVRQGRWHYTLITGTNRIKRKTEIVSGPNHVQGDWVNLRVHSFRALQRLLRRVPRASSISLPTHDFIGRKRQLPPAVHKTLRAQCRTQGLRCF